MSDEVTDLILALWRQSRARLLGMVLATVLAVLAIYVMLVVVLVIGEGR